MTTTNAAAPARTYRVTIAAIGAVQEAQGFADALDVARLLAAAEGCDAHVESVHGKLLAIVDATGVPHFNHPTPSALCPSCGGVRGQHIPGCERALAAELGIMRPSDPGPAPSGDARTVACPVAALLPGDLVVIHRDGSLARVDRATAAPRKGYVTVTFRAFGILPVRPLTCGARRTVTAFLRSE